MVYIINVYWQLTVSWPDGSCTRLGRVTADLARPDDAALRGPARVHQQDIASLQQHRGRGAIGAEARHAHHRACTGEGRGHHWLGRALPGWAAPDTSRGGVTPLARVAMVLVLDWGSPAPGPRRTGPGEARCWAACTRHVVDPHSLLGPVWAVGHDVLPHHLPSIFAYLHN